MLEHPQLNLINSVTQATHRDIELQVLSLAKTVRLIFRLVESGE